MSEDGKFDEDLAIFNIYLERMQYEVDLITVGDSTDDPLQANELFLSEEELKPYGTNALIDVIPFEMLYTAEENPQVIVTVEDMPAVCASLNCDYTYIENNVTISDFTFDGTSTATMNISS